MLDAGFSSDDDGKASSFFCSFLGLVLGGDIINSSGRVNGPHTVAAIAKGESEGCFDEVVLDFEGGVVAVVVAEPEATDAEPAAVIDVVVIADIGVAVLLDRAGVSASLVGGRCMRRWPPDDDDRPTSGCDDVPELGPEFVVEGFVPLKVPPIAKGVGAGAGTGASNPLIAGAGASLDGAAAPNADNPDPPPKSEPLVMSNTNCPLHVAECDITGSTVDCGTV